MTSAPRSEAIAVRTVELSGPLGPLTDVAGHGEALVFVLWKGQPIGRVHLQNGHQPISAARLREAIASGLSSKLLRMMLAQHLTPDRQDGTTSTTCLAPEIVVSIVLATRDRPDELRRCLRGVVAQRSPRPVEIIVVDNNPGSGLTPPVAAEFPGVTLVEETRRGLAYARNTGILASRGAVIVTIDDDVTMPAEWLERLVAPFIEPEVMVVTGNVLPLELQTTAQQLFEIYGGLGRGFETFRVDGRWFKRFRGAVPTWQLGCTANAAFRAGIFSHRGIGLMDEALGAGMPTGCSEDTYVFYKVLKAGYTLVYEPSSYVWHRHRREMSDLRRQIFEYSKGHVAYHLTTLLRDHDLRAFVRLLHGLPQTYLWRLRTRLRGASSYPASLLLTEIAGNLAGPWALLRARLLVKRYGSSRGRP